MEFPENEKHRRISALREQMGAHPFRRAHSDWRSLNTVLQAYVTNADQLIDLIADPESDSELVIAFMRDDHQGSFRQRYYDELFRCLHNYLSILTTLIDHSRNLMKRYEGTDFDSQYKSRVATLKTFPGASFLRNLRNYLIHYCMVPLSVDITIKRTEPVTSFQVILVTRKLLEWSGWKADSKPYLESHDEIVLRDCVEGYTEQATGLYDWAYPQFEALHGEDFDDYERLRNEVIASGAGGGTTADGEHRDAAGDIDGGELAAFESGARAEVHGVELDESTERGDGMVGIRMA